MTYKELNVTYEKPYVWRRPTIEKFPRKGKAYLEIKKEEDEFKVLQEGVKKEISGNIKIQVDSSHNRNELNHKLDEIFSFYGKSIIPTNELDDKFLLTKTNQNTLNKKLQGWCKNLVHNIPEIISTKPYNDLIGKFNNVPAFVCLAGPSLKNNMESLKKAKGKSIIIAVDTSLRPLLNAGIVPDICVTHDANPNGCKFFLSGDHDFNKHNVQLNELKDKDLAVFYASLHNDKKRLEFKYDTLGLFVNYCHPLTLLAWNGRAKSFYGVLDPSLPVYDIMASSSNYKIDKDNNLTPENKGRVVGGSSVGHVATYIAVAMGCNPISLLGLDLSYPGGKTYVEGASNQKAVNPKNQIEMDSLSGDKVFTNLSMLSYKMVFEKSFPHILVQRPDLRMYNCTEDATGKPAGILEVGAEPKSLAWVIENKCRKDVDIKL